MVIDQSNQVTVRSQILQELRQLLNQRDLPNQRQTFHARDSQPPEFAIFTRYEY
jgi:hypothetical protein